MSLLASLADKAKKFVAEVQEARNPKPVELEPDLPVYAAEIAGTDQAIVLPKVKTFDHPPTIEEQLAEARRIAWAYARERSDNADLTWKQAKHLIAGWVKEEKELERQQKKEAAATPAHVRDVRGESAPKIIIASR
jgi:hypothetical protein